VIVAIILLTILIKRPAGLTGGREFQFPRRLGGRKGQSEDELEAEPMASPAVAVGAAADEPDAT
jgi:hypothetical protein